MKLGSSIEKLEKSENIVDKDLNEVELFKEYSLEEKAEFTREIIEGVFDGGSWISKEAYKNGDFGTEIANGKDEIRHFLLPGMRGCGEPMDVVRESYIDGGEYNREYKRTNERVFVNVGQGRMFEINKVNNVYFMANISECSIILAKKDNKTLCAHISMSYADQIDGVLQYLDENGYEKKDVFAIASVGDYQENKHNSDGPRYTKIEDYVEKGIDVNNILSIEYHSEGKKDINVSTVVVGNGFVCKYSYDMQQSRGMFGYIKEKVGEEREFEIMETK